MSEPELMPEDRVVDEAELEQPENAETVDETEEVEAQAETDEESATSEDDAEPAKPKRRSRAEERINALTREKYEAQQAAAAAQRRAEEIEALVRQQQMQQPAQMPMPTLADYDYDENAYQQAVQSWNQAQIQGYQRQQAEEQQRQAAMQAQQQEAQLLQAKIQEGNTKYPDFQQKVMDPNLPPLRQVNQFAFQAVMDSPKAVDIAYYMASNPATIYEYAQMNPVQAIKAVAQLEAKLSEAPRKAGSAPPRPPTRVKGKAESVTDPSKLSTEDWMEWRQRQLNSKR